MVGSNTGSTQRIPGFCALCTSRCGAIAVVEDGRLVGLEPDPSHPTGRALCVKGRVAPELVYHPDRILHPLKRTRPKGSQDPGWEPISWDEALDTVAGRLAQLAADHGPESVVFTTASPSTSALSDSLPWIGRLRNAFGSPSHSVSMELCGWGRYLASQYVFGAAVPGEYMPDLDHARCVLFWGYNPSVARLAHATATVDALNRGARLVVVDPRRVGFASRAHHWLQVRPGTDGALALGLAHVMIERGWFDREFIRQWTNSPLLLRSDTGRLLRASDVAPSAPEASFVTWDEASAAPAVYHPSEGVFADRVALAGAFDVATRNGVVPCHTVFDRTRAMCARYSPDAVADITGVPADELIAAARTLWECRPTAFYSWSGVEQQTGSTQTARAINLMYALTGSFDVEGGNVLFTAPKVADISGAALLSKEQRAKALGLFDRPLGGARFGYVTSGDIYRAILDHEPYAVHGMVSFGSNLLVAHADGRRGRQAIAALDFHVHADMFMNPTAELADIVLPVTTPFESEGLQVGFEISQAARSRIQLRKAAVTPQGEARSDVQIVFDLACRLGLGDQFWDGDIDAAYRAHLEPSGVTLEVLRDEPAGVQLDLRTTYRKYSESPAGVPQGFRTQTRKIELHSETMAAHGYPALPDYEEPLVGPRTRADLIDRYPLVLTCAKDTNYLESQGRGLPTLRRRVRDPQVQLHPDAAAARGIAAGDWVSIETPNGSVRARAQLKDSLPPDVVCGQHGWWQECREIGAPGFDPFGPDTANFNLLINHDAADPVSGSVPLRSYLCQVSLAGGATNDVCTHGS
jgi:anaerobic selenocysteine-containing dehydrogenase